MSKDIRSFFNVISKTSGSSSKAPQHKKPVVIKDSDDEDGDILQPTPEKSKRDRQYKRKIKVLDSDSDEGKPDRKDKTKKRRQEVNTQKEDAPKLKLINLDALNRPIKQAEVKPIPKLETKKNDKRSKVKSGRKNTELGVHGDKAFEKTLEELDEDSDDTILLDNLDVLDKTIEEATRSATITNDTKKPTTVEDNQKAKTAEKIVGSTKNSGKRVRNNSDSNKTPKKKLKTEDDSMFSGDFEKQQKKRHTAELYAAYLHRGGPKHHGEKDYPKGTPDCLKGLTFLRTGVLDSLEQTEFEDLVTSHSGAVSHSVTKKVSYVVVGEQAGPSKLEKAKKYKIPEISEDEFLDLILTRSNKKPQYATKCVSEDLGFGSSEGGSFALEDIKTTLGSEQVVESDKEIIPKVLETEPVKISHEGYISKRLEIEPVKPNESKAPSESSGKSECLSWTEKYKPVDLKALIGQQDPNSNMNKLKKWLENWFENQKPEKRKKLPKPTLYNQFDGAYFKAALLSGSPGVGKTTVATLVAKDLGFDIVEFNASDTRNKKLLHEEISHMMKSKTVAGFVTGQNNINQKRILLMDEVDGMAGNEDRGGIAELINFIKTASFPIVCMCNNRDLPKMRSLVNHCYALKFGKPNVKQIAGAMKSVCFREGLDIKIEALIELITGTGCDIRQTLNHLSMWSAVEKTLSTETVKKESSKSHKDVVIGAWDVIRKVFSKSENKDMNLADKARLFFYDYSFGPMFVQENYINVEPELTRSLKNKNLEYLIRTSLTADALSSSDLIESKIRSSNNWSLLDCQAYYSTVLPSHYLSGNLKRVAFPSWFGKNSQRNKSLRMIGELHSHTKTHISGDKMAIRLDYAQSLMSRLVTPLVEKQAAGIDESLEVMRSYTLLREDLTNLCELMTSFSNKRNPFDSVSSAVKAALTRKYNKTMVLSFAPPTISKKKKNAALDGEDGFEEEDLSENEETEETIDSDALIKVKAKESSTGGKSSKPSGSKDKKSSSGGSRSKSKKK